MENTLHSIRRKGHNDRLKFCPRRRRAMTLVEVTLALGILSFCAISLMGLLPVMLQSTQDAREQTLSSRIYQAMALEIRENNPNAAATYEFSREGLLLRSGQGELQVTAGAPVPAALPGGTNSATSMIQLTLEDTVKGRTNLLRPLFVTHGL